MMELTREEMAAVSGGRELEKTVGVGNGCGDRDYYTSVSALENSSTGTTIKNLIKMKKSQNASKETTRALVQSTYASCAPANVLSDFVDKWWDRS